MLIQLLKYGSGLIRKCSHWFGNLYNKNKIINIRPGIAFLHFFFFRSMNVMFYVIERVSEL